MLQWIRGNAGVIRLPVKPEICQIVDPSGAIVAISRRECYHNVKVVTVLHEGVWLARYNMYGMLDPVELRFRVETVGKIFCAEERRKIDSARRKIDIEGEVARLFVNFNLNSRTTRVREVLELSERSAQSAVWSQRRKSS